MIQTAARLEYATRFLGQPKLAPAVGCALVESFAAFAGARSDKGAGAFPKFASLLLGGGCHRALSRSLTACSEVTFSQGLSSS